MLLKSIGFMFINVDFLIYILIYGIEFERNCCRLNLIVFLNVVIG